jgi:hypothetical protein
MCLKALPARGPATQRSHIGFRPSLVDKNETAGINPCLMGFPARPFARDVRPKLLAGQHGFF